MAAEVIPPVPPHYFNDYAGVISSGTSQRLNQELDNFEKQTSSQIVVAVYPKMQSDSDIADYAVRVFEAWEPGLQHTNNGAILLVFVQDHKMRIATGYGLEGALPDATCKRILDTEITPRFKQGDFDGGLTAGVEAMMAAAKGEYKGTGQTVDQGRHGSGSSRGNNWFVILIIIIVVFSLFRRGGLGFWGGWMSGRQRLVRVAGAAVAAVGVGEAAEAFPAVAAAPAAAARAEAGDLWL